MKKLILLISFLAFSDSSFTQGMPVMDIANLIQNIISYGVQADEMATQALQYENQILQYQAMVKNLEQNPLGAVLPNYSLLVTNAVRIQQNNVQIANGMGQVSANIQKAFKTPQPNFGSQYALWIQSSQNASQAAMLNAGLQREALQQGGSDQAQLQSLVNKNMASGGNLAALQTLGEFMSVQIQESQKLRDLISAQQAATNTQIMADTSIAQAKQDQNTKLWTVTAQPMPVPRGTGY
jgi:P-type conjugative transfer protein TrbJ